jgi:hypothetical protein
MAAQRILVPYNFTAYEEKALDFVIRTYAHRDDVQLTLFNAYTPLPVVDMDASPELTKMRGAMVSLARELKEKEAGLKAAKDFLVQNGFSDDQIDYIFKEREKAVADEIIDTATKGHYRVLVLSRQPGKVSRLFARSVHNKVLISLKDVTVCIPT